MHRDLDLRISADGSPLVSPLERNPFALARQPHPRTARSKLGWQPTAEIPQLSFFLPPTIPRQKDFKIPGKPPVYMGPRQMHGFIVSTLCSSPIEATDTSASCRVRCKRIETGRTGRVERRGLTARRRGPARHQTGGKSSRSARTPTITTFIVPLAA